MYNVKVSRHVLVTLQISYRKNAQISIWKYLYYFCSNISRKLRLSQNIPNVE